MCTDFRHTYNTNPFAPARIRSVVKGQFATVTFSLLNQVYGHL